jgi:hypothetical protein
MQDRERAMLVPKSDLEFLDEDWGVPTVLREIYEDFLEEPGFVAMLCDHNAIESNDARPFEQVGPSVGDSRPDPDCLN